MRKPFKSELYKLTCCLLLVIMAVISAGCWDRVEVEQLTFVTAVGIDRDGPNHILVSFHSLLPRNLIQGDGGGGGGGGAGKAYAVVSIRARSVGEALRLFEESSSRKVRFKQLELVILGEELARSGVTASLDIFTRRALTRRTTWVLVARGKAEEILLKAEPREEKTPVAEIRAVLQRRPDLTATRVPFRLGDFLRDLSRAGVEPMLSAIELRPCLIEDEEDKSSEKNKQKFTINSSGVFKNDRLVGFLGPFETRGALWVRGKVPGGTFLVPASSERKKADLIIIGENTKVTPVLSNGELRFKVEIETEGYVSSVLEPGLNIGRDDVLHQMEQELEKAIKQEVMDALEKARLLHCDFLGLGEVLYRKQPGVWKQIAGEWEDTWLSRVPVDLKVDAKLKFTGLTAEPIKPSR